eukprot:4183643-Amphidinium_carterae.1
MWLFLGRIDSDICASLGYDTELRVCSCKVLELKLAFGEYKACEAPITHHVQGMSLRCPKVVLLRSQLE